MPLNSILYTTFCLQGRYGATPKTKLLARVTGKERFRRALTRRGFVTARPRWRTVCPQTAAYPSRSPTHVPQSTGILCRCTSLPPKHAQNSLAWKGKGDIMIVFNPGDLYYLGYKNNNNHGVFTSTTLNFISELGRRICVHTGDARETEYSSYQPASPLRELTCRVGSHSVTCHPAEVTFPPLPQPKPVLNLATPERCKAELTQLAGCMPRRCKRPKTVTHPSTNRARRGLTSFMRRTPLTTTPRRQHISRYKLYQLSYTNPRNGIML